MQHLTVAEVARRLSVSQSWVRRRSKSGEIPFRRYGRLVRISEEDLAAWCAAREGAASAVEPCEETKP